MKKTFNLASAGQFFIGMNFLFVGLLNFTSALSYDGLENNFSADNWGVPLTSILALLFGFGWWVESFIEQLLLSKGRKFAVLAFLIFFLVFLFLVFSPLSTPFSFWRFAVSASGYMLMSGFYSRFSMARPEVLAKVRKHN